MLGVRAPGIPPSAISNSWAGVSFLPMSQPSRPPPSSCSKPTVLAGRSNCFSKAGSLISKLADCLALTPSGSKFSFWPSYWPSLCSRTALVHHCKPRRPDISVRSRSPPISLACSRSSPPLLSRTGSITSSTFAATIPASALTFSRSSLPYVDAHGLEPGLIFLGPSGRPADTKRRPPTVNVPTPQRSNAKRQAPCAERQMLPLHRCSVSFRDIVPINRVPKRGDILRPAILMLQVVRVLPNIDSKNRCFFFILFRDLVILIWCWRDLQIFTIHDQPSPTAPKKLGRRFAKLLLKIGEAPKSRVNCLREIAGGFTAVVLLQELPEQGVIEMTSGIVADRCSDVFRKCIQAR